MKIFIALLRGVNVGGKHLLPMKELVTLLDSLGCWNVKTYIQSGNAVFESEDIDALQLAEQINIEIEKHYGFLPSVLLLDREGIEHVIANNPFPEVENDPKSLHVGFLASIPKNPDLKTLEKLKKDTERICLRDNVLYWYAPEGIGRSKLAAHTERLLGVSMTNRNWRTVCNIRDMAQEFYPQ